MAKLGDGIGYKAGETGYLGESEDIRWRGWRPAVE